MWERLKRIWEWFKPHAERVIALGTIVAICLVVITYRGIKKSNKLLEQQIRVENRAFVSIEPECWKPEERNKDKYTCAYLHLTNYGNKPARGK